MGAIGSGSCIDSFIEVISMRTVGAVWSDECSGDRGGGQGGGGGAVGMIPLRSAG